jgi:hypothetical protein
MKMVGMQSVRLMRKAGLLGVPGGVAACFEGVPDAAAGEAAGVGLLLNEHAAIEALDAATRRPIGSKKASCFSALVPVSGWNQ